MPRHLQKPNLIGYIDGERNRLTFNTMDPSLIAAFWLVSILFVITPGADWAYAITAGLQHRRILPAIGGLLAGHLTATIIVSVGVAEVVARSPVALATLSVVGAFYLIWLGIGAVHYPTEPHTDTGLIEESPLRKALRGYGISGLNPKVFLLFLVLLPQFTDSKGAWLFTMQVLVLGLIHIATCGVIYTAVGARARAALQIRPAAVRGISRFFDAAMVVIGILLIIEQFKSMR